jgi:hypothetical protein
MIKKKVNISREHLILLIYLIKRAMQDNVRMQVTLIDKALQGLDMAIDRNFELQKLIKNHSLSAKNFHYSTKSHPTSKLQIVCRCVT